MNARARVSLKQRDTREGEGVRSLESEDDEGAD